jgi:hypothetical protein
VPAAIPAANVARSPQQQRQQQQQQQQQTASPPPPPPQQKPAHSDLASIAVQQQQPHAGSTPTALEPWWRLVEGSAGVGLTGEALAGLAAELARTLSQQDNHAHLLTVASHRLSVRVATAVEPSPAVLRKAGLELLDNNSNAADRGPEVRTPPAHQHRDEFSELLGEATTDASALVLAVTPCGCRVYATTAVLRLRLNGLAAVLSRDLFDPQFDDVLAAALSRAAGVPAGVRVRVLGKRYGSVVVFVSLETCVHHSNGPRSPTLSRRSATLAGFSPKRRRSQQQHRQQQEQWKRV